MVLQLYIVSKSRSLYRASNLSPLVGGLRLTDSLSALSLFSDRL